MILNTAHVLWVNEPTPAVVSSRSRSCGVRSAAFPPFLNLCFWHVDVSKNTGTPKWMVYNGKTLWTNGMIWGFSHIFGSTPLWAKGSKVAFLYGEWSSHLQWGESLFNVYLEPSHDLYFWRDPTLQEKAEIPIKTAGSSKGSRYIHLYYAGLWPSQKIQGRKWEF